MPAPRSERGAAPVWDVERHTRSTREVRPSTTVQVTAADSACAPPRAAKSPNPATRHTSFALFAVLGDILGPHLQRLLPLVIIGAIAIIIAVTFVSKRGPDQHDHANP